MWLSGQQMARDAADVKSGIKRFVNPVAEKKRAERRAREAKAQRKR